MGKWTEENNSWSWDKSSSSVDELDITIKKHLTPVFDNISLLSKKKLKTSPPAINSFNKVTVALDYFIEGETYKESISIRDVRLWFTKFYKGYCKFDCPDNNNWANTEKVMLNYSKIEKLSEVELAYELAQFIVMCKDNELVYDKCFTIKLLRQGWLLDKIENNYKSNGFM